MPSDDWKVVQQLPGNQKCMECSEENPDWASSKLGIVLCLQCAGIHRGLGTHLSFVRSVTMDSWTPDQIKAMKVGGNDVCRQFLQKHGGMTENDATLPLPQRIRNTYDSPSAELYRQVLKARVQGTPEPTELPTNYNKTTTTNTNNKPTSLQDRTKRGFGSGGGGPQPAKNRSTLVLAGGLAVTAAAAWMVLHKGS